MQPAIFYHQVGLVAREKMLPATTINRIVIQIWNPFCNDYGTP